MAERKRLGDILIQSGKITDHHVQLALEAQKNGSTQNIGALLIGMGFITEEDVAITLSDQLGIPYGTLENGMLKPSNLEVLKEKVDEKFARKNGVLPIAVNAGKLTVAITDPLDAMLLENLKMTSGCQSIERIITTRSCVDAGIDQVYGEGNMLAQAVQDTYGGVQSAKNRVNESVNLDQSAEQAETGPVIQMTDLLIKQAIKARASDIHIEPFRDTVSIRYRIDGKLHPIAPPAKQMALPLVSRIKVLSKMDIGERRLPQDGSFTATIDKRSIDFRVSSIPTVHGEKIVIRILDQSRVALSLDTLGLDEKTLQKFREVIKRPHGMVLVTGPTGSGKTTTLYSALTELKTPDVNITTMEDPVEYQIDGINQVEAKSEIGLTFSVGLRSFLRQDPDIMLVGEIRDLETAQICIRAALTGHMVFSTLHTNDAPTAISRLIDVGVEPFFVAASLQMIVAQRLVRRLCDKCRKIASPNPEFLPEYLRSFKGQIYEAGGCDQCSGSGYKGRVAIHEIMFIDSVLAQLISKNADSSELRNAARKSGMKSLEESGFDKVMQGLTSIEEIHSITIADSD